jgi:hypothetical protein
MSSLTTPEQAAAALYAAMPHALSRATLDDYGLDLTDSQAAGLTRELLIVNLFWTWSVLDTTLSNKNRDRVFGALLHRLMQGWTEELALPDDRRSDFEADLRDRHACYADVVANGGVQVTVLSEAASLIESDGTVPESQHQQLMGLLIDMDASAELGETADEIDLGK